MGNKLVCPGQDVKRYPSGVQLDNRKVFILSTFFLLFNKQYLVVNREILNKRGNYFLNFLPIW